MRVLVCGSRNFNDYERLEKVLDSEYHYGRGFTGIIHVAARGADTLAGEYARRHGLDEFPFPALWDKHGKAAGPIRNTQMLVEGKPEYVIAFLAPNSRGTKHMISIAEKAEIPVTVVNVNADTDI